MSGPDPEATLCLVVPVYNEEERVCESLNSLRQFIDAWPPGSQLVFVDDGSTDRTIEVLTIAIDQWPSDAVTVVRRPHAGKGAAVRAGLSVAKTDLAAFCDVDLATPLDELDRVIATAASGSCLAIGSRATPEAVIQRRESLRRELAGKAFNRLVRILLCGGVADTQCGAKAAPTAVWQALLACSREVGFAWDVEAIALAGRLGVPVHEIGVRWIHDDRTRVNVVRDGVAMVLSVPRIWLRVRRVRPERAAASWSRKPRPTAARRR